MPERRRKQRVAGYVCKSLSFGWVLLTRCRRVEALESKIDDLMAQISHLTKQNGPETSTARLYLLVMGLRTVPWMSL